MIIGIATVYSFFWKLERTHERTHTHTHTHTHIFTYFSLYVCNWSIGLAAREFNLRSSHTKDSKNGTWCLIALSIIRYGSRVKWSIQRKELWPSLHLSVVTIEKGAFGLPSTMDYFWNSHYACVCVCVSIYIYIYIYTHIIIKLFH